MKKLLFYIHHPAQFHLLKNIIDNFKNRYKIIILSTKKDVLDNLLQEQGISYINVLPNGRKDNKVAIAIGLMKQDIRLLKICFQEKPDILIGTSTEIAHIGKLLNIPSLFLNEDDIDVVPLVGKIAYPFAKHILIPKVTRVGKYISKSIKYESYHELAYLHPNNFKASSIIAEKYIKISNPFFILRFAKLGAHHDVGIQGISNEIALKIITILKPFGSIYITSERELDKQFEQYRIQINPSDMHHVMAVASLYIGDSQTMAAEAGVLGVPFIRFNDFVGRISYLDELENKYELGYGIKPKNVEKLYQKLDELLNMPNRKEVFLKRRKKMLSEKIDYAAFLTWFIEEYPKSVEVMKKNPDYQYRFR